jgi:hypothetical protein
VDETSAVIMYNQDAPHEPVFVAVLGGSSPQARRHAVAVAEHHGRTAGRARWETDARLNRGRPYRLYELTAA